MKQLTCRFEIPDDWKCFLMKYLMALTHAFLGIIRTLQNAATAVAAGLRTIDQVFPEDIGSLAAFTGIALRDALDGNRFGYVDEDHFVQYSARISEDLKYLLDLAFATRNAVDQKPHRVWNRVDRIGQNREHEIIRCEFVFHVDKVIHPAAERRIMSCYGPQLSADIDVRQMQRAFQKLCLRALTTTS